MSKTDLKFIGFERPKSNYSKLPHTIIDALHIIDSLAELKVVLYVLRHTWGYQEYGDAKRITMDEFEHGRKSKNGRIDNGTGMVRNSIKSGIEKAVRHGFLIQEKDGLDEGRSSYVYYLNMLPEDTPSKVDPLKNCSPGPQKLTPCPSEVEGRSEKETEKETEKELETETVSDDGSSNGSKRRRVRQIKTPSKNDVRRMLEQHFLSKTGVPDPPLKTERDKKAYGSLWGNPIREIANLSAWNVDIGKHYIDLALERLDGLTISDPNSIIKTVRAIHGELSRNGKSAASVAAAEW